MIYKDFHYERLDLKKSKSILNKIIEEKKNTLVSLKKKYSHSSIIEKIKENKNNLNFIEKINENNKLNKI